MVILENQYQDCIEELTAKLADERKFRAAFELWFTEYKESRKDKKSKTPALYSHMHMSWITAMRHIDEAWLELKAQHLDGNEEDGL